MRFAITQQEFLRDVIKLQETKHKQNFPDKDGTLDRLSETLIEPLSLEVKEYFDTYSKTLLTNLPKAIKLEAEGK